MKAKVTLEAVRFGVRQRLTAVVTEFEYSHRFVDVMEKGAFHSLRHTHLFEPSGVGTLMTDVLEFEVPFGLFGRIVDRLILERYMRAFLRFRWHCRSFISFAGDFSSYQGVVQLLQVPEIAIIAWLHILAFDQLVGRMIYLENMERKTVHVTVQSICLFLTLLAGPVGYLLFTVLKWKRK